MRNKRRIERGRGLVLGIVKVLLYVANRL